MVSILAIGSAALVGNRLFGGVRPSGPNGAFTIADHELLYQRSKPAKRKRFIKALTRELMDTEGAQFEVARCIASKTYPERGWALPDWGEEADLQRRFECEQELSRLRDGKPYEEARAQYSSESLAERRATAGAYAKLLVELGIEPEVARCYAKLLYPLEPDAELPRAGPASFRTWLGQCEELHGVPARRLSNEPDRERRPMMHLTSLKSGLRTLQESPGAVYQSFKSNLIGKSQSSSRRVPSRGLDHGSGIPPFRAPIAIRLR